MSDDDAGYTHTPEALDAGYKRLFEGLKPDLDAEADELAKRPAADDFYIGPDATPLVSTLCDAERLTVQDVLKRHRRRFGSNHKMAKFLGSHHDVVGRAIRGTVRLSLKMAGKWARLLQEPTLVGLVMQEYADGVPSDRFRGDRMSLSADAESLRHLYDWYMKSLGKGLVPHGSVHHLMAGIFKRLKARKKP